MLLCTLPKQYLCSGHSHRDYGHFDLKILKKISSSVLPNIGPHIQDIRNNWLCVCGKHVRATSDLRIEKTMFANL